MSERIQTQGFVIQRQPFGDSDLIVHLLTHSHGVVSAFASGVRNSKKRFPHQFNAYYYYDLAMLRRSGELYTITRCDARKGFQNLSGSLEKIAYLGYFTEIIREAAPKEEANRTLFHFMIDLYLYLENHDLSIPANQDVMAFLELRLIRILGFEPELGRCLVCHRVIAIGDQDARTLRFSCELGGVVHEACGSRSGKAVTLQTLHILNQAMAIDDKQWRQAAALVESTGLDYGASHLRFSSLARTEVRNLLPDFLEFHLGRPIKSRRFLNEVLA